MKFHPNVLKGVYHALDEVFQSGRYADKVIEGVLKSNPRWGSRDRRFIAESTYEIVRWYRLLATPLPEAKKNSPVDLFRIFTIWKGWELDAVISQQLKTAGSIRAIRESIPDWLDETGLRELGELKWESEIKSLNQEARVVLRANTLRTNLPALLDRLRSENIETERVCSTEIFPHDTPHALMLSKRMNVFSSASFKEGLFEVQDAASQLVSPFLDVRPGQRIVDACAGAGGKTLHLAALSENKGKIIALDTGERKLEELKRRARRAGASNIEARLIDSAKVIKRLYNTADRLLLDVPCSGLGVLKRNPDAKWKLSESFLAEVRELQKKILADYSPIVKSGGKLVYSTCSILPSENTEQVRKFLESSPDFKLEEELSVMPSEGFDGFYMARLRKQ